MGSPFRSIVSTLCYSLIEERCPISRETDASDEFVARFVLEQFGRMPDHLRLPLQLLTLMFGFSAILRWAAPFHRLQLARRRRWIQSWHQSRLRIFRDLIRFYESLVVYCWYEAQFNARDEK